MPAPALPANKPCCSSSSTSSPSTSVAPTTASMVLNAEKYVGVDVHDHFVAVKHSLMSPKLDALRMLYGDKKIIVGPDVAKGVLQKLRTFEKLLHDYPEWRGEVTSPALTDSPKLEQQVSELVAHINGDCRNLHFIPVHHYHQSLKKDDFYASLEAADLGAITRLRDGVNTTSMEFFIAQERTKKSPLVLSEFMGISQHMSEALQADP
ncbi:hypothetical protein ID866_9831 [Astraeus odoratus]|nr:hypothetical protein ID866_9831 [Astraeus odoratus]